MRATVGWIWLCAYLNCAGWTLSVLHELNAGGYAVALGIVFVAGFAWLRQTNKPVRISRTKWRRRFRRGFPLAFLVLASMVFLGGAIYAPANYDALAYRMPRILHWLDANHWYWIHTIFDRLNNRSCGIEWVSAPVIALVHSLRPLFLINFLSFLLLPGLVFSVFTRLGVRARVAWHWMWLAPTGYCFLLQAGSIGNDLFGAMFALAAVDMALRAAKGGGFTAFSTSILAAAMMTSAKTNNLPLLLPWAVALLPAMAFMLRRPLATVLVSAVALGASVIPTIYFNWHLSGDWSGARLASNGIPHAIVYRTGANVITLGMQNLVPPIFPMAGDCNQAVQQALPLSIADKLAVLGEAPGCWFQVLQMQTEEAAGLGLGLVLMLGTSFIPILGGRAKTGGSAGFTWSALVRWASVVSLAAVLTQANVSAVGRLLAAYYLLPCTIVLSHGAQSTLVRKGWWRGLGWLTFLMGAVLLVVSPARPLFPRTAFLHAIQPREAAYPVLARADEVYSTYRDRSHVFDPVLAVLPAGVTNLGYFAFDKPETALWQPFGSRRIVHVRPEDTAEQLKAEGVHYIFLDSGDYDIWFKTSYAQWLESLNAIQVREFPLRVLAGKQTSVWYLIQLR